MNIKSIFGRGKNDALDEGLGAIECPHTTLVPRWDNINDMGKEDAVSGYFCEGCQQTFTPEQALGLMTGQHQRLQQELVGGVEEQPNLTR